MISYMKLKLEMVRRGIDWPELIAGAGITQPTARKLKRDQVVDLATLEKICFYLDLDIGDIMEIKKGPGN